VAEQLLPGGFVNRVVRDGDTVRRDAYGLAGRGQVVATILWWQDRCWRGIDAGVRAGDPAMARLRAAGAVGSVRAAYDWVLAHQAGLEAALQPGGRPSLGGAP
jgi:hypothetical protein